MKVKVRIGNSTMVLEVTQNFVLRDIAVTHFKSKSITVDLDEYCFKIPNYDYFLDLDQSINDLLDVAWVFQDREPEDSISATIILIRKGEKGDALQRESLTIDPAQEASLCVWAFKRGGSTGGILSGFKKRYFVLQSNTLYYSESPGSPILGYIPMSGISSKIRTDIQYKDKISFELTTSSNSRSYILCADQVEFSQLHQCLDELQLRRVKSSVVTLFQELISRDVSTLQGIFRISGEKFQVESLKLTYDQGLDPKLDEYPSEVIAGVIKQYIRSLESPVIGFGLYNEYLRFGKMPPGAERTEAMLTAVKRLPNSQRHFLHYLCLTLKLVSSFHSTNLMTTKNLSIVIGPNLLRPQRETTQSAMNDNQFVLSATQALIDEVGVVFGTPLALKVPDTPTTTQAAQQRQRAASVTSSQRALAPSPAQQRANRMSISEIDPSLVFVQDLKNAMQTSKTLGGKIQEMTTKHQEVMTKWNDLIRAIKANPTGTMNFSEIILNQSEIDTHWIDQGLSALDQVHANLSELVELLGSSSVAAAAAASPQQQPVPPPPQHQSQQSQQSTTLPSPVQVDAPFHPPHSYSQQTSPTNPHQSFSAQTPSSSMRSMASFVPSSGPPPIKPNPSSQYAAFQIPSQANLPPTVAMPLKPPPPPAHKRNPSQYSHSSASDQTDIPPPPPPDED